jgi:hypothetical protein
MLVARSYDDLQHALALVVALGDREITFAEFHEEVLRLSAEVAQVIGASLWPEESDDFALGNGKADPAHGFVAGEPLGEIDDFDHRDECGEYPGNYLLGG